jgi:CubicO group peptidase (beta-lactamase class C family)
MEFASFIDGFFAGVQRDLHVSGLSFIAVRDGEVLYSNGYGYADTESETPVSPDATLFRVGSISKLVTATAVMQLAEKGRLGLDEDVNSYLRRSRLPGGFEKPVTLRHLLTHTAGFDYKELEVNAPTSTDERMYASRLQKIMPARYATPGKFYSYSNMGYTLLGSIIERYSRLNFQAAIARHIFQPLGMSNSAFTLTEEQARMLAAGCDAHGNPVRYEYRYDMPAVGMSATASDMGRFMIAQLNGGMIGRTRILTPTFADSMLRRHFSPHPSISGTGLAYYERTVHGLRTLQQSCDFNGYSGFLMLIPDRRFGLFYSANRAGLDFSDDLASAVVERFFMPPGAGKTAAAPAAPDPVPQVPPDIAGYYRINRVARHTAEKIMSIAQDQIRIDVTNGKAVTTHTENAYGASRVWLPSSRDLLRMSDENGNLTDERLFVQRDDNGKISAIIIGDVNHTYDKLETHESRPWQIAFVATFAVTALLTGLGLLAGMAVNKNMLPWEKDIRSATELWGIAALFSGIQLSFITGLAISAHLMWDEFVVFVPYQVKALFVMPLAGGVLVAWLWFRILGNLFNPDHHWAEKLLLCAVACVETGYMFFLADWRMLGFMF